MANSSEGNRRTFKQSQSMMTNSFNMGELLRDTTSLLTGNCDVSNGQNEALDLSINERNMSRESVDTESLCSSLHVDEIVDSDEEDIAELDQMLLKLKSIGVKIKSVANNQAKVINTVKKNSKKISDLKNDTARKFSEFTGLIVDRMDSSEQIQKAECDYKKLELEKSIKQVEAKVNVLGETSEELHCLSGDLIAKKMVHEKRIKNLEDHQYVLESKLQKNLGSSSAVSPWINKYPMPKFSGHKRERPMRFLRDFERYISVIDISTNDFNYIIYACLEGIAREWWELVSQNDENINTFRDKFIKKYWNENVCFQISSELQFGRFIPNNNLSRAEYAIKLINNAKDLIPPPSESEIVAKLSRHFHDDIRTAIIIRNIKTFEQLMELLDAFDQAGPSNANPGNNSHNLAQNHRSYPNVYGETLFSNQSNFRDRDFGSNSGRNNFGATAKFAQQNRNLNYNRGQGFAGNNYRNNNFSFPNNVARFEGHHNAPTSRPGTNLAHDHNNRRDTHDRNFNPRQNGNGYVQNGVYHRRENVGPPNTAAYESGRSQGVSGQEGMRKVRVVASAPSVIQGRSNENLNTVKNCEPENSISPIIIETCQSQGN